MQGTARCELSRRSHSPAEVDFGHEVSDFGPESADFGPESADFGPEAADFGTKPQTSVCTDGHALLAYASDGTASDEPGEESVEHQAEQQQVSGGATPAATEVEFTAEERLLAADGSEGGILSFLASCPPLTKLKINRKFLAAAELEESWWEDGGIFHYITRNSAGRVGDRDEDGKWSIDQDRTPSAGRTQLSPSAWTQFSHGDLVELLFLMFETVTQKYAFAKSSQVFGSCAMRQTS